MPKDRGSLVLSGDKTHPAPGMLPSRPERGGTMVLAQRQRKVREKEAAKDGAWAGALHPEERGRGS